MMESLQTSPIKPVSFAGPGLGINISSTGDITMNRTPEAQGVMDRLLSGMNVDEAAYSDLLSQIRPGFGRLTDARTKEISRAAERAVGNLRDNLARRNMAGASFAEQQIGSLQAEFAALEDKARAESIVEELKMTNDVISSRTQARNQSIATAWDQIQFEGNLGGQLLQSVMAGMNNAQMAMVDLAKTIADVKLQIQKARAGVITDFGTTFTSQGSEFADIASQEAAGPGQLIGTATGTALGNSSLFE